MDKLQNNDMAFKEFELVLKEFPDYPKKEELKHLLKDKLSQEYKLKLIQRKNKWKFYISLIDILVIFLWKVVHEYFAVKKSRRIILDIIVCILLIANIGIWWLSIDAEAQLDMLAHGIIDYPFTLGIIPDYF